MWIVYNGFHSTDINVTQHNLDVQELRYEQFSLL